MNSSYKSQSWRDGNGLLHRGGVWAAVDGFSVIECEHCKFKHVVPLPTDEELRTVYSHEYYTSEKPLYIEHYLQDKAWWDGVYADRFQKLESYLGPERRRILDIGSGPGLFLLKGKERGWQVKGIEPSAKAAEHSRVSLGLDVEEVFLSAETAESLGKFDAVNLGEVLEHLPNPAGMLELAFNLLNGDGILCLIVPNDFNPIQMVLRDHCGYKPWWVAPPHHLNYFNFQSIAGLVERTGFEVLHMESTFPIDMFLLMGQNYIGNDIEGRKVHGLRKQFDENLFDSGELRNELYRAFANCGVGREVVLYARKKHSDAASS